MRLRMWMYDAAREQSPTLGDLRRICDLTLESGYNALGLYLEHRFAYPSTPWSHGAGCITPEMILALQDEFAEIDIVPFINLLGHFEGMIYTEAGKRFREETFKGLQACPSTPEFVHLCHQLIDDTVSIFKSNLIHIGGDETQQLGACSLCKPKVEAWSKDGADGKAVLYGKHFGPLARKVLEMGRRPAVWGDMYQEHSQAMELMPKETLIFDWQYFNSPLETSRKFVDNGFEVVCCPAVHTYNAIWCHLPQTEQNVKDHVAAAHELDAHGICVTTWELGLFGNYETLFPLIKASGALLNEAPLAKSKAVDEKPRRRFFFNPTRQMQDTEEDHDMSIAVGITDSIFMNAIDENTRIIEIERVSDRIQILFDGRETGQLPLEQGDNVLRRISLLSNLNILRPVDGQEGNISGRYTPVSTEEEMNFEFEVQATGGMRPAKMVFAAAHALRNPKSEIRNYLENPVPEPTAFLEAYIKDSETYGEWARLMGVELAKAGGIFQFGGIRSSLKVRLLLMSNPFLCWMYHHEELCGEVGEKALATLALAIHMAPDVSTRGIAEFGKAAIDFVRFADQARQAYAQGLPGVAVASLTPCRQLFENLEKTARATNVNVGGSLADIERCRAAREHVERVIRRIRDYGDGSLGYLPAFEIITHPKFMPHDQASWWLINRWANE